MLYFNSYIGGWFVLICWDDEIDKGKWKNQERGGWGKYLSSFYFYMQVKKRRILLEGLGTSWVKINTTLQGFSIYFFSVCVWLSLAMLPLYSVWAGTVYNLAPVHISSQRNFAACFQKVSEIMFSKTYQKTALCFWLFSLKIILL